MKPQTTEFNQVQKTILAVAELIGDESRWLKHRISVDQEGRSVDSWSPLAARHCVLGGIYRLTHDSRDLGRSVSHTIVRTFRRIHPNTTTCGPYTWNDLESTTHAQVMELLMAAVEDAATVESVVA